MADTIPLPSDLPKKLSNEELKAIIASALYDTQIIVGGIEFNGGAGDYAFEDLAGLLARVDKPEVRTGAIAKQLQQPTVDVDIIKRLLAGGSIQRGDFPLNKDNDVLACLISGTIVSSEGGNYCMESGSSSTPVAPRPAKVPSARTGRRP